MNWKVARELRSRGRDATSIKELGWANQSLKDGALCKKLAERGKPCVLIAWDNKMVECHRRELDHHGITLAVVDRKADRAGLNDEQYYREVIHHHARRMASQPVGSKFKYSLTRRTAIV